MKTVVPPGGITFFMTFFIDGGDNDIGDGDLNFSDEDSPLLMILLMKRTE